MLGLPVFVAALLFLLPGLALAGACIWLLRRRSQDLHSAIAVLEAIAAGDLTRHFDSSATGDAKVIATAAGRIVGELSAALSLIEHSRERIGAGWRAVNEVSLAMSASAESVVAKASIAASGAAQVSSHVHAVAASAEELATTIRSVAAHAAQASMVATTAFDEAEAANGTVQGLQSATGRVEEIVRLITAIAGQTHLLALNATIEAARAGEAGRGFAVVAGEVKSLARETADATHNVTRSMNEIRDGSSEAAAVMARITETINVVSDNQNAIAAAVEQQTSVTLEIGRSAAAVAVGSDEIARSVSSLAEVARTTAYAGAQARTTAAELAGIEESLAGLVGRFIFEQVEVVTEAAPERTVTTVDGVTTIWNSVKGTGHGQFHYAGSWCDSTGNIESGGMNSYSSGVGDTATLRFAGTKLRFYGVVDANHGIAAVSVDDGLEVEVDEYAADRATDQLLWESEDLDPGEHRFTLRTTGRANPDSRYCWTTICFVEIVD